MLLLGWTKGLRHYWLIALLRVTLASQGKLCISDFQGLAVLSLQDSLRSSTQEGRIVPGWLMRQGETLLLWKSKDKKCCLYKMPYVAAPMRVLGDVIAKFSTLRMTNFGRTCKNQKFFLVNNWCVSEETPLIISILLPAFSTRRSTSKSGTRKDYLSRYLRSPTKITFKCLFKHTPLLHVVMSKRLRNQEDRKKGTLSNQPQLTRITPTAPLGNWVLQPIEVVKSLGTDFEMHAKWQGSVEEPAAKDFVAREVRTIKLNKVKGTPWNANKWEVHLGNCPEAVVRQATINFYSRV